MAAIHRIALWSERTWDRWRARRIRKKVIAPYIGYADPEHLVVRGRVLGSLPRHRPDPSQSLWLNFRQMVSLFLTDEVADVEVAARGVTAISGQEGYFTLLLPRDAREGWVNVDVSIRGQEGVTVCPVLIARDEAEFAVVSDIDDTMMKTGAYSIARNLWTSLTGNALTRKVFEDAPPFMETLSEGGRNPVYYVSSSPWNLHYFLRRIFERAGLVPGPKFLRDLGMSETKFITGTHGDHKGDSIDVLLAANPTLPYVLVGDTGQHDAFVYRDAVLRHPGRIRAVVLREPGPGPDAESLRAMEEIAAQGVLLLHAPSFGGFAPRIRDALDATAGS